MRREDGETAARGAVAQQRLQAGVARDAVEGIRVQHEPAGRGEQARQCLAHASPPPHPQTIVMLRNVASGLFHQSLRNISSGRAGSCIGPPAWSSET
jgi:hypothetical protein